jgi:serine/threonine protein kinase
MAAKILIEITRGAKMTGYIGEQFGNYLLLSEIANGSFGSVYLARHHILTERQVAIKILHASLLDPQQREQFLQEARFLEQLQHPSILPLVDVGFKDHLPYLVTQYAAGGSLRDRQRQASGILPTEAEALAILTQVGQALAYAHHRNIIHRDLKPENILFTRQGRALLADFGIATMLATVSMKAIDTISGTPPYMAPEQFRGHVSKESDQYALGCIAYELFTGRRPFSAPDFVSMGFLHTTEEPKPPSSYNSRVAPHIERAILKALAKQRSDRHPDIAAFLTALTTPDSPSLPQSRGEEAIPTRYSSLSKTTGEEAQQQPPQAAPAPASLDVPRSPVAGSSPPPVTPAPGPGAPYRAQQTPQQVNTSDHAIRPVHTDPPTTAETRAAPPPRISTESRKKQGRGDFVKDQPFVAVLLGALVYALLRYMLNGFFLTNDAGDTAVGYWTLHWSLLYTEEPLASLLSLDYLQYIFDIPDWQLFFLLNSVLLVIPYYLGARLGIWASLLIMLPGALFGDLLALNTPLWYFYTSQAVIAFFPGLAYISTQGKYETTGSIVRATLMAAIGPLLLTLWVIIQGSSYDEGIQSLVREFLVYALLPGLVIFPILLIVLKARKKAPQPAL